MGQLCESFPIAKLCSVRYGKMWVCSHGDLMTWLHKKWSMIWDFSPAQLGTDSAMSAYIIYLQWIRFWMTHSTRIFPPLSFLLIIIHFAFPCLWEAIRPSAYNAEQCECVCPSEASPMKHLLWIEYMCLGQGKAHVVMSSGYTFAAWTMEVCSCDERMMNVQGFLCMQVVKDSGYCLSWQPLSLIGLHGLRPSVAWYDYTSPLATILWQRLVNACQNQTAPLQDIQIIALSWSAICPV